MSFANKAYEIEKEACSYLRGILDEKGSIELLEGANHDIMDWDEVYELPCQLYIGKHDAVYRYYIIKLYKDLEGYFAKGLESEEGSEYQFQLEELDSFIVIELADLIQQS